MSNETTDQKTALLVIDVQEGNTADGWDREAVIERIRTLIDRAKGADVPVLWVQHESGPFVPGTPKWEIVERVRPGDGETVIGKQYLDAFVDTPLRKELDDRGVTRVVVCGAATDACIRSTAFRALIEGYDTTLVGDAHTTDVGPWDLDLPDGSTVPVGGKEMVALVNFMVADSEYPGVKNEVVNAADVTW